MSTISAELAMLHRLVITDLNTLAHFRTAGPNIHHSLREEIYKMTGFPFLKQEDASAEAAEEILKGPMYRMLSRHTPAANFKPSWHGLQGAGRLFDNGMMDVQFGGIVLENGEIRPFTARDQAAISDAADDYSASK